MDSNIFTGNMIHPHILDLPYFPVLLSVSLSWTKNNEEHDVLQLY